MLSYWVFSGRRVFVWRGEMRIIWYIQRICLPLQSKQENGLLAEWLGTGLQNRLRRFESARDLKGSPVIHL